MLKGLCCVEYQEFGVCFGLYFNRRLVFDRRAVALPHFGAIERDDAAGQLQPYAATRLSLVIGVLTGSEIGDEKARVLMQADRAIPAIGAATSRIRPAARR
jgi:hypothetical protein